MRPDDENGSPQTPLRPRARPSLVFVYNADSGLFNALADAAHKIFSPRTYGCNLCALTHTAVGMRGEWRRFLEGLGAPLEFLHADELRSRYGVTDTPLPAIFEGDGEGVEVLVDADSINACRTLDDLKSLVLSRSKTLGRSEAPAARHDPDGGRA